MTYRSDHYSVPLFAHLWQTPTMISVEPITSKEGDSPIAVVLPIIKPYQQRNQLDSVILYVSILYSWMWVVVKTLLLAEIEALQQCLALLDVGLT